MKRFSKIVSVIVPTPPATVFRAANCACMSVGNAGYGAVRTSTALSGAAAHVDLDPVVTDPHLGAGFLAAWRVTASRCSGRVFLMRTWPRVMAPATR